MSSANIFSANIDSANIDSANIDSANIFSANIDSANIFSANIDNNINEVTKCKDIESAKIDDYSHVLPIKLENDFKNHVYPDLDFFPGYTKTILPTKTIQSTNYDGRTNQNSKSVDVMDISTSLRRRKLEKVDYDEPYKYASDLEKGNIPTNSFVRSLESFDSFDSTNSLDSATPFDVAGRQETNANNFTSNQETNTDSVEGCGCLGFKISFTGIREFLNLIIKPDTPSNEDNVRQYTKNLSERLVSNDGFEHTRVYHY
jgi:hypothetical protein